MSLVQPDRRFLLVGATASALAPPVFARTDDPPSFPLELSGTPQQSGLMLGRTVANARIRLDDIDLRADENGAFVIGFDRDAPREAILIVTARNGASQRRVLTIAPRTYKTSQVNGLPPGTVNPPPEVAARIAREAATKNAAFASIAPGIGFLERFSWPVSPARITSPWGAQRILNGSKQRPHYGIDIGVPTGTAIRAPASGVIIIAEPDYWFEGGLTAIDHGQGLQTIYLHQSRIDVKAGQQVTRGTVIGAVGAKGRATGPHLCWRMRWRGRQCDPSLRTV